MAENFTGKIGHLEDIASPWAAAGGVAKTVADTEALARTGVGWIEDGSQTLEGRPGNAINPRRPELGEQFTVYYHNKASGETGNSLGMPGRPIDEWVRDIPEKVRIAHKAGKAFVQNIAPVSDNPLEESKELIARSYEAGADAVLLNAGCPNVRSSDGGRHELLSRNALALAKVLFGLKPLAEQYQPLFLRISPQENYLQMSDICWAIRNSRSVSAVFVPNTWPDFVPLDEKNRPVPLGHHRGGGGLSGPAVAAQAAQQTEWAVEQLEGAGIDVVSSAGIMNVAELERRLKLGAAAAAGTTFYYESADWRADTDKLLQELAE